MLNSIKAIFSVGPYVPHGHCYLWQTGLVGLHVLSDALIALAYYSIPIAIFYFVRNRSDLPFKQIFLLFGTFIVACGTTHLMEIWTLWYPTYWLSGGLKAATAVVSLFTAIELVPLVPLALSLPSPAQLEIVNRELKREIAERQQVEAALRQSEERYRAILEDQTDLICRYRPDTTIVFANDAFCRYFEIEREALIGNSYSPIIFEADLERVNQLVNSMSRENPIVTIENRVVVNGEIRWTQWINRMLFDPQGHFIEFQSVGRDFTDLKQTEEALRQSEAQNRAILKAVPDLLLRVKRDGSCLDCILPKSQAQSFLPIQQHLAEVLPPDLLQRQLQLIEQAITTGKLQIQEHYFRKQGKFKYEEVRMVAINHDEVLVIVRDITNRKQIELDLQRQRELREAIFTESADAIFLVDPDTRLITDCNERAAKLFEVDRKDLIGIAGNTLQRQPFTSQEITEIVAEMQTKGFWSRETEYVTRRGNLFWGSLAATQIQVANQPIYLVRITDITANKRAEVALRQSEQKFKGAFDTISVGMCLISLAGGFQEVNAALCQLLGYSEAELLTLGLENIIDPDDQQSDLALFEQLFTEETANYQTEKRFLHRDGRSIWGLLSIALMQDLQGRPLRLIAQITDISGRKQAEQALHQREQEFRTLAENSPDLIARIDRELRHQYINPVIERKTGIPAAAFIGKTPWELGNAKSLHSLWQAVQQAFNTQQQQVVEFEFPNLTGELEFFNARITPEFASDGSVQSVLVVSRDITKLKRIEQALFQEKELAQVTLQSIGDAVITTDATGRIEYFNPVAESLTGWHWFATKGMPLTEVFKIVNEITRELVQNPVEQALREGRIVELANHTVLINRHGQEIPIEDSAAPIRDREGRIIGAVMVFHDVTQARSLSRQLSWQASHDALTGLVNRREFETRLEQAVNSAKAEDTHALCYLDLDQFKIVNDTCGHTAGDELLRQVTTLLQTQIRKTDILARLGGDEFAVLLNNCPLEKAGQVANTLCEQLQIFRFIWQDKQFAVGVSIGLAMIDTYSKSAASVLSAADAACYVAKNKGRNRVHIYQANDLELAQQQGEMRWVTRLTQALEENWFRLYYQQIVPVTTAQPTGEHYEVLLRLQDETGKIVSPMAFIPAAERYNLMHKIDRWVIRTLFTTQAQHYQQVWHRCQTENYKHNHLYAINLSGASINDEQFIEFLHEQFTLHQIPPQIICFEITETVAIANLSKAAQLIEELRSLGCRFALDDFGSGMSSFAYLKHLPVDYLKIDGGFIQHLVDDPIDEAIVEAIGQIGQAMGIQTVAEFVENDAILDKVRALGVNYAQGYGIATPCPLPGAEN